MPDLRQPPTYRLVLLRHGESEWNAEDRFTGWVDIPLTAAGRAEATRAGDLLAAHELLPDVVHTSVLRRAITTADTALDTIGRAWIPVHRSWRLNERHYGALQGKDKQQTLRTYGEQQFMAWRRSYAEPPPPIDDSDEFSQVGDQRYRALPPELLPRTECLADVVARALPYWYDAIVPDLRDGKTVLVVAHGNSIRALVKHLDQLSDEDVVGLNIPTGMPLRYDLDLQMRPQPTGGAYLDPAAAATGIAAVAGQGRG
ncbi:MAG: phosphoglyceromutase [Sciscionella sp.]